MIDRLYCDRYPTDRFDDAFPGLDLSSVSFEPSASLQTPEIHPVSDETPAESIRAAVRRDMLP
jgi:hypothetical protein